MVVAVSGIGVEYLLNICDRLQIITPRGCRNKLLLLVLLLLLLLLLLQGFSSHDWRSEWLWLLLLLRWRRLLLLLLLHN